VQPVRNGRSSAGGVRDVGDKASMRNSIVGAKRGDGEGGVGWGRAPKAPGERG